MFDLKKRIDLAEDPLFELLFPVSPVIEKSYGIGQGKLVFGLGFPDGFHILKDPAPLFVGSLVSGCMFRKRPGSKMMETSGIKSEK